MRTVEKIARMQRHARVAWNSTAHVAQKSGDSRARVCDLALACYRAPLRIIEDTNSCPPPCVKSSCLPPLCIHLAFKGNQSKPIEAGFRSTENIKELNYNNEQDATRSRKSRPEQQQTSQQETVPTNPSSISTPRPTDSKRPKSRAEMNIASPS